MDEENSMTESTLDDIQELRCRFSTGLKLTKQAPIGREEQFEILQDRLSTCIQQRKGGAIYASGPPGTGKSMTIHAALRHICQREEMKHEASVFLSINCMQMVTPRRVAEVILIGYEQHAAMEDPYQIYFVHEAPKSTSRGQGIDKLKELVDQETKNGKEKEQLKKNQRSRKRRKDYGVRNMMIVFLDEIDTLISKDLTLVKKLFAIAKESKRFVLIGASNSLDLGEKLAFDSKPEIVLFPAYKSAEVALILKTIMSTCEKMILSDRSVEYLARKAASSGMGDMRQVLNICLTSLASVEHRTTQNKAVIDIQELMKIFNDSHGDAEKTSSAHRNLKNLPLDQQILLFTVLKQTEVKSEKSDQPPKKKLKAFQKAAIDPLNSINVYQRYREICQTLCVDSSSRQDMANMLDILANLGLLITNRSKKFNLVRLKESFEELRSFFEQTRIFAKLL